MPCHAMPCPSVLLMQWLLLLLLLLLLLPQP
jgi:hypothetical protein